RWTATRAAWVPCAIMRAMATVKPERTAPRLAPGTSPLAVKFCGLDFATPLVLLSGCVGFGEEYTRIEGFSNRDAGAVVLKGTTGGPLLRHPPHRASRTHAASL